MTRTGNAELLGYVPPVLHRGKLWYIDYYAVHPITSKLTRVRVKVNRVKGKSERLTWARALMAKIDQELRAGWNPWTAQQVSAMVTLGQAFDQYDRTKDKQLRHSSPYSYRSMTQILREWCREHDLLDRALISFNRNHAVAFLQYATEEREIANRTYNNYLTFFGMLFRWTMEQRYRTDNPFDGFRKRKQAQKTRTYLNERERAEMVPWIRANDPQFLVPCLLIYGALIRPGELRRLKIMHLDLERQVITVPAEQSKSGAERQAAIPHWLHRELVAAGLQHHPGKAWLIGSGMQPGHDQIGRNVLNGHWVKMRSALAWDATKQLYSLRDTGIIQLLRDGVDLLHVRQQAGHTDISTTNAYLRHAFPNGPAEVRAKSTHLLSSTAFEPENHD